MEACNPAVVIADISSARSSSGSYFLERNRLRARYRHWSRRLLRKPVAYRDTMPMLLPPPRAQCENHEPLPGDPIGPDAGYARPGPIAPDHPCGKFERLALR